MTPLRLTAIVLADCVVVLRLVDDVGSGDGVGGYAAIA